MNELIYTHWFCALFLTHAQSHTQADDVINACDVTNSRNLHLNLLISNSPHASLTPHRLSSHPPSSLLLYSTLTICISIAHFCWARLSWQIMLLIVFSSECRGSRFCFDCLAAVVWINTILRRRRALRVLAYHEPPHDEKQPKSLLEISHSPSNCSERVEALFKSVESWIECKLTTSGIAAWRGSSKVGDKLRLFEMLHPSSHRSIFRMHRVASSSWFFIARHRLIPRLWRHFHQSPVWHQQRSIIETRRAKSREKTRRSFDHVRRAQSRSAHVPCAWLMRFDQSYYQLTGKRPPSASVTSLERNDGC